jgi:cytoskeletal protein CcmA (bactofilin family)
MEPTEPKTPEETPDQAQTNPLQTGDSSSLENSDSSMELTPIDGSGSTGGSVPPPKGSPLRHFISRFNVYLLLFLLLVVVAVAVVVVAFVMNRSSNKTVVQTQSLTESTLKQLADRDVTVGQPKQVLNVQSNAVFAGKVLVRDNLEVAGTIQVGGSLSIPGITVSGNSVFDQVQVNRTLSVAGDSTLQGQLSVQKNLSVAGKGTFGGVLSAPQITANTLQLNGDLNLTHHITAGGATPGRVNGPALGSGGGASVSGSDTAGTVNVNTGSGATAGCFVTINFTQKYNATPYVLVTPVGLGAAGLGYYINRSTGSFSICAANTPPSSASFGFDYFVLD